MLIKRITNCRLIDSSTDEIVDIYVSKGKIRSILPTSANSFAKKNEEFDAKGRLVLPGFIDCHCHPFSFAESFEEVNLVGVDSISQMRSRIRSFYEKLSGISRRRDWIFGRGWDQDHFREHRWPNKKDLDLALPNTKAIMTRICGHVAVMNSRALEYFREKDWFENSPDQFVPRDPYGSPNGIVKESVLLRCWSFLPKQRTQDLERLFLRSLRQSLKFGLIGLHCILDDLDQLEAIRKLDQRGRIRQKISLFIPVDSLTRVESMTLKKRRLLFYGKKFRVLGFKLFADGSLGARTAALTEEYSDDPGNEGVLYFSEKQLVDYARRVKKLGLILATHAIGDLAVEQVLRAFEKAGIVRKDGFRIEHCSIVRPELLNRLSRVVVTIQPSFAKSDYWLPRRIGRGKKRFGYCFKTLARITLLAGSSDAPVESINPLTGIESAISNRADPAESLSIKEAINLYTKNASKLSPLTLMSGSIDARNDCDLILLDKKKIEEITQARVIATFIDGIKIGI